jgi:uncharacterized protein YndB with AHSA1/START domain
MKNSIFVLTLVLCAVVCRADAQPQLAHEGVVEASVHSVWEAYTTKAGLESWMVAHAEIDLRVGGILRTHYDPKGKLGDSKTIENTILSYEPERMLSLRVSKAPEGFPFPNAVQNMWTVVYFEAIGSGKTRLREVSLGFGGDDESKNMREFFERGNAATLAELQKHFSRKASKK